MLLGLKVLANKAAQKPLWALGRKLTYHSLMTPADLHFNGPLEQFASRLERSLALGVLIDETWEALEGSDEAKIKVPAGLCSLALDHGRAVRVLLPDVPASAIALLRPQYESLLRAVWARHAATASDLSRLLAPLTLESQQAAKKLPGVPEMLAAIEKSGPKGAAVLLGRARGQLWDGLNSFIHGGIHPFRRGQDGYPLPLLIDLLKNTNAMSMLTLFVLADIAGDADVLDVVAGLHQEFQDVLPALEPLTT